MGRLTKYYVNLSDTEREYLRKNSSGGTWRPRAVKKALILLKADISQGSSMPEGQIAQEVGCCISTVRNTKLQFAKGDRLKVVEEKARSGRPKTIHGEIEAHIIATACSSPPEGRVRWTLHPYFYWADFLISEKSKCLIDLHCYSTRFRWNLVAGQSSSKNNPRA